MLEEGAETVAEASDKITSVTQKTAAKATKVAQKAEDNIDGAYTSGRDAVIITLLIAILAGVAISFAVANRMAKRIGIVVERLGMLRDRCATELREGLNRFAQGDLTQDVQPSTPELHDLGGDEIVDTHRAGRFHPLTVAAHARILSLPATQRVTRAVVPAGADVTVTVP